MSPSSPTTDTSLAEPRLELFMLQLRGQEMDFSWLWPAATSQLAFADILSSVADIDTDFLSQLQACSLNRLGGAQQVVWMFANASPDMVCSVNGQVLEAGSQLRLDHGDEIELGLMRLLVSLEPSQGMPALPDWEESHVGSADDDPQSVEFELTDLDAQSGTLTRLDAERQSLKRSDFGDLIAFAPEEMVLSVAQTAPTTVGVEEPSLSPFSRRNDTDACDAMEASIQDPLDVLHARYLAKLRNPAFADVEDQWQDLVRVNEIQQTDPMQHWMQAAGSSHSLDDLLEHQHSIASVIDALDALGSIDVLAPEPFDSVMHLFAPEHLRTPQQDPPHGQVQHSLPTLSQREHHNMSLDSSMPYVGGEKPLNASPNSLSPPTA